MLNLGDLSSFDKKIVHFLVRCNLPFNIVEQFTFLSLFTSNNVKKVKNRKHYSNLILPKIYNKVKADIQEKFNLCEYLFCE